MRGVYGGRTAAGDASRASGEFRSDPRRGRAVVKQNDKQTASRDDRAHRFGPAAQQVVAPTSCDVRCASLSRPPGRDTWSGTVENAGNETTTETGPSTSSSRTRCGAPLATSSSVKGVRGRAPTGVRQHTRSHSVGHPPASSRQSAERVNPRPYKVADELASFGERHVMPREFTRHTGVARVCST
jgi:hypothetical protein